MITNSMLMHAKIIDMLPADLELSTIFSSVLSLIF